MFDVKSNVGVSKSSTFDYRLYIDQVRERTLEMYLGKVTKEFVEEENKRKKKEAIAERNSI